VSSHHHNVDESIGDRRLIGYHRQHLVDGGASNWRVCRWFFGATILVALLLTLGCTTSPTRIDDSKIKIEVVPAKHLRMWNITVYKISDGILVKGDMKNLHGLDRKPKGHIDVEFIKNDGKVMHVTRTNINRFGKINKLLKRYRFSIEAPYTPADGSVMRLSYHESKAEEQKRH